MTKGSFDADASMAAGVKSGIEAAVVGGTVSAVTASDAAARRRLANDADVSTEPNEAHRSLGTTSSIHVSFTIEKAIGTASAATAFKDLAENLGSKVRGLSVHSRPWLPSCARACFVWYRLPRFSRLA